MSEKRFVEHVMGMPITLVLRGGGDAGAREAWSAVTRELRWVDEVFSTYRQDSFVSRLGRGEIFLDDCPPEVAEVMRLGEAARRISAGAFYVWLPDARGGLRLDPSGVVKGWAVQRAADLIQHDDFCLSAGGDMVCRSAGEPWRVGIEHPLDPSRLVAVVPVAKRRGGHQRYRPPRSTPDRRTDGHGPEGDRQRHGCRAHIDLDRHRRDRRVRHGRQLRGVAEFPNRPSRSRGLGRR